MADRTDAVYEPCDKAIKAMNRENLEAFGRLKMAKWDEVNIIRTVMAVYRKSAERARKRYKKVAYEAYMYGWILCGLDREEGEKQARKAIDDNWIDRVLTETDFVTLYRFDTETERKAYRLSETLEAAQDRDYEINKALRYWSRQLGQYAINMTDYALVQAYEDAGVEMIEWITQRDERVCTECHAYDGQIFRTDEIPPKHWNCRCFWRPVFRSVED